MRHELDAGSEPKAQNEIAGPLFETNIDFTAQGGLVVLDSGQIAEVAAPRFVPEGAETDLKGSRVKALPFWKTEEGIVWRRQSGEYDPARPTIGIELEMLTMTKDGQVHKISTDGESVEYPDGTSEPASDHDHAVEALSFMHECGSEAPYPRGYAEFRQSADSLKNEKAAWLDEHGLISPPVSGFPELITPDAASQHPVINMLRQPDVWPKFFEYAYCISEQLNIEMRDPESALFAINSYQLLQPVLNLVTAASPMRDGSFDTTLRQHYEDNPGFEMAGNAEDYRELASEIQRTAPKREDPETGRITDFYDQTPYDWRALARGNGSPSGGITAQGAPVSIEDLLRETDRQLRAGETMTIARVLGWHTDRFRPDKGVIELCNASHGGNHPEKVAAAQETAIKVVIALQEYYNDPHTYRDEWSGIIPRPEEARDAGARQAFVDAAGINNNIVAFYGKERNLLDAEGSERTLQEVYDAFCNFADLYGPEPIDPASREEVRMTILDPPVKELFFDADSVLDYFYSTGSNMTAAEALRTANSVEPGIQTNELLLRMHDHSEKARRQRVGNKCAEVALAKAA